MVPFTFCTNIYGAKRMNPQAFDDPLIFLLEAPAGQNFNLTSEIFLPVTVWIGIYSLYPYPRYP